MRRSRRKGQLRRVSSMRRGSHSTISISSSVVRGFGQHTAERIGHERRAPEFQAVLGRALEADAVDGRHVEPLAMAWARWMVRQASCCAAPIFRLLRGMPADGGGIEQDLRAGKRGQARGFGIPLIPADQRRDAARSGYRSAEAEIAGREVVFFEIERVVGDVHLAIERRAVSPSASMTSAVL